MGQLQDAVPQETVPQDAVPHDAKPHDTVPPVAGAAHRRGRDAIQTRMRCDYLQHHRKEHSHVVTLLDARRKAEHPYNCNGSPLRPIP